MAEYKDYNPGEFVGPVDYGASTDTTGSTGGFTGLVGSLLGAWSTVEQAKIDSRLRETELQQQLALNATSQRTNTQAASDSFTLGGQRINGTILTVTAVALLGLLVVKKLV